MIQNQHQNRDAEKAEGMESDDRCFEKFGRLAECFLPEIFQTTAVNLRSYDAALIEKATAACRLSNDIKRLRLELHDREVHIEFLREKHYRYKENWKKEFTRRERETRDLKNQLDQATSAKFIMFCKLQAVEVSLSLPSAFIKAAFVLQGRVGELEEALRLCHEQMKEVSFDDDDTSDDDEFRDDGIVVLDVNAQRSAHSCCQQSSFVDFPHKRTETVGHHPLQDKLSETYGQLREAQKRGDRLQLRLQQLEKETCTTSNSNSSNKKKKCIDTTPTRSITNASVRTGKKPTRLGAKDSKKVSFNKGVLESWLRFCAAATAAIEDASRQCSQQDSR